MTYVVRDAEELLRLAAEAGPVPTGRVAASVDLLRGLLQEIDTLRRERDGLFEQASLQGQRGDLFRQENNRLEQEVRWLREALEYARRVIRHWPAASAGVRRDVLRVADAVLTPEKETG